jgi:molecular chaperone HscB
MNYYEIFDLPLSPLVDHSVLLKKYVSLQRKNHPDFFTTATEYEKAEADHFSALINKGYNVLKNELEAIYYFLMVKQEIEIDEKYQLSPEFLMEMMEMNEDIDENNNRDAEKKVKETESELFNEVKNVLGKKVDEMNAQDLAQLKAYYYKKKYLNRILDRFVD